MIRDKKGPKTTITEQEANDLLSRIQYIDGQISHGSWKDPDPTVKEIGRWVAELKEYAKLVFDVNVAGFNEEFRWVWWKE